jgi:hypothetical protein
MSAQAQNSLISNALPVIILVDLLFFPRLLFAFGVPLSLLVILFGLSNCSLQPRKIMFGIFLLSVMVASVLYGAISGHNLVVEDGLKRAFQLFAILLYSCLRFDAEKVRPNVVAVLRFFYVWTFLAMLMFFYQPGFYLVTVATIYPESLDQLENTLDILRFAYFFSDPNSAAYLICFTLSAYLCLERELHWKLLCASLATITILMTQSRGGYVATAFVLVYFGVSSGVFRLKELVTLVGAFLALGATAYAYSEHFEEAYSVFESRFEQEQDLGGGRAGKYEYFLENINIKPVGVGYYLKRDGVEFRPHSDLIRSNLSYGILALPLLVYFVFPRRRSQVPLFGVFLIPFLINTVIDDFRLFGIYLLLFGLLSHVDVGPLTSKKRRALTV